MARDTYTQQYSDFIGVDLSGDPREVARNRLAYSVNMWRDYESEQGAAIETFPGFRKVAEWLGKIHGMYGYRDKSGKDYVIIHGGVDLYCYDCETGETTHILEDKISDSDSTGFLFNNKLYIQDGSSYITVSNVASGNTTSITAEEVEAYIPTTYFNGKPYEQRNMLVDKAYEKVDESKYEKYSLDFFRTNSIITENKKSDWSGVTAAAFPTYIILFKGAENGSFVRLSYENGMYGMKLDKDSCKNNTSLKKVDLRCWGCFEIGEDSLYGCSNLEEVRIFIESIPSKLETPGDNTPIDRIAYFKLDGELRSLSASCPKFKNIYVYTDAATLYFTQDGLNLEGFNTDGTVEFPEVSFAVNIKVGVDNGSSDDHHPEDAELVRVALSEQFETVESVQNLKTGENISFQRVTINSDEDSKQQYGLLIAVEDIQYTLSDGDKDKHFSEIKVLGDLSPLKFSTIENVKDFLEGNPDYEGTGVAAIMGCTKSAVYDGRIFLTGNPDLPNTIFYTQRNITGSNDPTYFGAYNYINDGDGNSPNVDLLSTPSMLMVLKNNTVQDGSVYYHVATDNTSEDQTTRDLMPRIYPSTSGAAGLGCAGKTVPGTVACNFLDDPVFLSVRGLEAVGKQTVNLERTLTHRSSNVDRLLIKEDLSSASITEWKGYLVICCNGHVYLADSRVIKQHEDGSYQYEWYYLEGIGCWEEHKPRCRYLTYWPNDEDGVSIGEYTKEGKKAKDILKICSERYVRDYGDLDTASVVISDGGWISGDESKTLYYVEEDGEKYLVEQIDGETFGSGKFYGAKKAFAVGELLFFGTENGKLLLVNTDKRGVRDYEGQLLESDRISREWYTFDGVAYDSFCSLRLDDCDKKALAKNTVSGTTVARFKMMPGSLCQAMVSLNGRDWRPLGSAVASRYDANDFDFESFAFAENEDEVAVLPELTRNWVMKQYLFKSGGYKRPFGLYELSYLYYVKGKIRR